MGSEYAGNRSWPGRPGWQYQRVLSVGFLGLLLLVAGAIGAAMVALAGPCARPPVRISPGRARPSRPESFAVVPVAAGTRRWCSSLHRFQ